MSRILVAEDEEPVRELIVGALQDAGHQVIGAADGSEALALLATGPEFDLLFTDIVMPGLDGFALARRARRLRPELKVVYASGYARGLDQESAPTVPGPLIKKPFRLATLRAVVDRVLKSEAEPPGADREGGGSEQKGSDDDKRDSGPAARRRP